MNHVFIDTAAVTAIQDDYRSRARARATVSSQENVTTATRAGWMRRIHRSGSALQGVSRASARPLPRVTEGVQPS